MTLSHTGERACVFARIALSPVSLLEKDTHVLKLDMENVFLNLGPSSSGPP